MKVKYNSIKNSSGIAKSQIFLNIDKLYDVFGLSVFQNQSYFLIVDDNGNRNWYPSSLFDISDAMPKEDWIIGVFEGDVPLLIGPDFLAGSLKGYTPFRAWG